ncbi:hypothetical protein Tco_1432073 [Tanacetum coccineum]
MLNARKRVGPLPTYRLSLRYTIDYSSLDHFTSDDSSRDSLSDSSSPTSSVPVASPVCGTLSAVRADLLLPRKKIRDSDFMTNFEVSSEEGYVPYILREIGLGVDVEDSYEPYIEPDIDPDVQADINACIAFTDDITAKGTDV